MDGGTITCSGCGEPRTSADFPARGKRCLECRRAAGRVHYRANRAYYLAKARRRTERVVQETRAWLLTYLRGHPSFPGPQMRVSGPYRIVVAKDRFQHTGERRRKVIFQLPDELLQNIRGQGDERLVIRVGDGNDWVDIEFYPTGLTKRRDMKRLIEAARERVAGNQRRLRA